MEKQVYLVTIQKQVFLQKKQPVKKVLVKKNQLIELLDSEYIVFDAKLVEDPLSLEYQDIQKMY